MSASAELMGIIQRIETRFPELVEDGGNHRMAWDYTTYYVKLAAHTKEIEKSEEELDSLLEGYGIDGWKLIRTIKVNMMDVGPYLLLIFKRRLQEQST